MKSLIKKRLALVLLVIMSFFLLSAEEKSSKTSIENLYSYKLDNGLSVYVAENHSAPLVYIEVTVRTGACDQTMENAGLFHLYEHMMFKGNSKYRNAQAIQTAVNNMGVPEWNGTTSTDRVNYFFTVPVNQLEKGLEFWSYAIREPLMNEKEFEDEKKVVISEIQGYFGKPYWMKMFYTGNKLFPEAPWTVDSCGSVEVVQNATLKQLREIQKKYYVPNNAAVLVGGDVNPEEVYVLVKKIFGDWKKGENTDGDFAKQYDVNPFEKPKFCVLPYNELSPEFAQVLVISRASDADFDLNDTYTGAVLAEVLNEPSSSFKKAVLKNKKLGIPDSSFLDTDYSLSRQHGIFTFSGVMINPSKNLTERVNDFYQTIIKNALPAVQKDKSLEYEKKRQMLINFLNDENAYQSESAEGVLKNLSALWTHGTKEFFFTLDENLKSVNKNDLDLYIENYFYKRNPMIMVFVNPEVYEKTKQEFENAGYELVNSETAFWWKK